jgi:hypothetical protein
MHKELTALQTLSAKQAMAFYPTVMALIFTERLAQSLAPIAQKTAKPALLKSHPRQLPIIIRHSPPDALLSSPLNARISGNDQSG